MNGIILLLVLLVLVFYFIGIFNGLVSLRNRFKNAFAQIDVQLQRRHELIPNLVESAKAYMAHEKETLSAVIEARNQAVKASSEALAHPFDTTAVESLAAAETALNGTLGRLFALVENYPDIKADKTMSQLMEELTSTENKVSYARQAYNDAVMNYNTYREKFPNSIVSTLSGFYPAVLFRTESPDYKKPVKVSF